MTILRKNKYYEFARALYDEMRAAYPNFSWIDYTEDVSGFVKSFEKILLKKLKNSRTYFSRKDLDLIAENIQELASAEGSELFLPKSTYEFVEGPNEEKYLAKDEVISLTGFLAIVLNRNKTELDNAKSLDKQKMLCLSFNSNPYTGEKILDAKCTALVRGINKKYNLSDYSITMTCESEVMEFFDNKEIPDVNWVSNFDSYESLPSSYYDLMLIINPELCNLNIQFNDYEQPLIEGVQDYLPLGETLTKYSTALKSGGRLFFIIETIHVDNEFLEKIQYAASENRLYMETVANFYSFQNESELSDIKHKTDRTCKLALIILRKDISESDYIKFINIDNSMKDIYVERLINTRFCDSFQYDENIAFFSRQIGFSDETGFKELTDKLRYNMIESYYNFFYQNSKNKNYVELVRRLFEEKYANEEKEGVSKKDWQYINELAGLTKSLGLYYAGYQDELNLTKAKRFLEIALWCRMDISNVIEATESKIADLKSGKNQFADIKRRLSILCSVDLNSINLTDLLTHIEQMAQNVFEKECWEKLQKETRIYIKTAIFSFVGILSIEEKKHREFDFSGVISLLMRSLEFELKIRFCIEYLHYLQTQYPDPYKYLKKNGLAGWGEKNVLVKYNKDEEKLCYISYDLNFDNKSSHFFSLGKIDRFTGFKESSSEEGTNISVDITFLDYLKSIMKNDYKRTKHESKAEKREREKKIKAWVGRISGIVTTLKVTRDKASHGGIVLNIEDAVDTFNKLILVDKVLKELVSPF